MACNFVGIFLDVIVSVNSIVLIVRLDAIYTDNGPCPGPFEQRMPLHRVTYPMKGTEATVGRRSLYGRVAFGIHSSSLAKALDSWRHTVSGLRKVATIKQTKYHKTTPAIAEAVPHALLDLTAVLLLIFEPI